MNSPEISVTSGIVPHALTAMPSLIEAVFPAQKVSFEAQAERTGVQSQTLTGLGSYWKGRKPLILVRALILGMLLPQTEDREADLEVYEKLLAFDDEGLARRAAANDSLKLTDIAASISLNNPNDYFVARSSGQSANDGDLAYWTFPIDCDALGIKLRWKRDITIEGKLEIYRLVIKNLGTYEEKASICKRPEEVDADFLYEPVWDTVNKHYGHLGVQAYSFESLVEQLGILRYGHRPRVGDTFAGGGSIPFEAARIGCDSYGSDLNPIACMLSWAGAKIIGASSENRAIINKAQKLLANEVDAEITKLGIEHDKHGNRAKAYLWCLETRCPETGWMVPLSSTWVISKSRNAVAKLFPDPENKRFNIEVISNVSAKELSEAEKGTVRDGVLVYELNGVTYRTTIKTLRGDYRDVDGNTVNRLRKWRKEDFKPDESDIFQERLYAIQWIKKETLALGRQETYFTSVSEDDLAREHLVEQIVRENIKLWQETGLIPDMAIEPGEKTDELIRTRGWSYWHHLFTPRQILVAALVHKHLRNASAALRPALCLSLAKMLDWSSKLCRYGTGAARESIAQTFYNQAYNTNYFYGVRSFVTGKNYLFLTDAACEVPGSTVIRNRSAAELSDVCDLWITDPPYADAVNYHEIAEFFIAWLRKSPPNPFDTWVWDSRRPLAIKGVGDDFRRGMIAAYKVMALHMPDNGMQCVMFTHQDTGVWTDMVGIFWAAGLQVVAAWYIATETTSELKKGGYVQGTVTLMLRKRLTGDRPGFKQRILPAVRAEVRNQIEQMLHLNEEARNKMGEPVFNDADLQMAGYAAALKVLTAYTQIGDTDVTTIALRPRVRGEVTVVDEIVQQASEAANSLLVPEGLQQDTWQTIGGVQRFYLRMMDMESAGVSKLDNYQNFAKAFRVEDYTKVMASMSANSASLKQPNEFSSRELTDSTEIGPTWLGALIVAIQQVLKEVELKVIVQQLMEDVPEFLDVRPKLIDIARYLATKSRDGAVRNAAEVLADRMQNQRALGQD